MLPLALLLALTSLTSTLAFNNSRFDNVAVYWGQNSYGAATGEMQEPLSFYCKDNSTDVFPIAFLSVFFGPGGEPSFNFANICNPLNNGTFPGTKLPNCTAMANDIKACQSKGKIVTLSLGGAVNSSLGFQSSAQASTFANTVWNLFLGGSSSTRPFGKAVLDGVDLDIELGSSRYYDVFVKRIRSLASEAKKKYYVTAAPQCVFPDAFLGSALDSAEFDAVYVQFYNNPCGLQAFNQSGWNFGIWDNWARKTSLNRNVKIYLGAPASASASQSGYVPIDTLSRIAVQTRMSFPSFGGVMLWDASQAYANNRYASGIKKAMVAAGGSAFHFPKCSAPTFVSGNGYATGALVTFGGYIWEATTWASYEPASDPDGEWNAISACTGPGVAAPANATTPTNAKSTTSHARRTGTPSLLLLLSYYLILHADSFA